MIPNGRLEDDKGGTAERWGKDDVSSETVLNKTVLVKIKKLTPFSQVIQKSLPSGLWILL